MPSGVVTPANRGLLCCCTPSARMLPGGGGGGSAPRPPGGGGGGSAPRPPGGGGGGSAPRPPGGGRGGSAPRPPGGGGGGSAPRPPGGGGGGQPTQAARWRGRGHRQRRLEGRVRRAGAGVAVARRREKLPLRAAGNTAWRQEAGRWALQRVHRRQLPGCRAGRAQTDELGPAPKPPDAGGATGEPPDRRPSWCTAGGAGRPAARRSLQPSLVRRAKWLRARTCVQLLDATRRARRCRSKPAPEPNCRAGRAVAPAAGEPGRTDDAVDAGASAQPRRMQGRAKGAAWVSGDMRDRRHAPLRGRMRPLEMASFGACTLHRPPSPLTRLSCSPTPATRPNARLNRRWLSGSQQVGGRNAEWLCSWECKTRAGGRRRNGR